MSFGGTSLGSGGRTVRRAFEFGRTHMVKPKGKNQATIVWLHGLGDNGSSWSQLLETLPLPNIKWISPTAPQAITLFGGFPSTAWNDVVHFKLGQKSAEKLKSTGFQNATFKAYSSLGHCTIPEEMDKVCSWLTSKLGLEGKR